MRGAEPGRNKEMKKMMVFDLKELLEVGLKTSDFFLLSFLSFLSYSRLLRVVKEA